MAIGPHFRYAAGVAALALVAGCTGQGTPQEGAASDAARRFVQARVIDPAAACALLAPKTLEQAAEDEPCTQTVSEGAGEADEAAPDVDVYGSEAIARFGADTVFLALFDSGWKVTAAACQPQAKGRPYDCDISGG